MKEYKTRKIAFAGMFIAIGILLPQAFHIFGQQAGTTFLPMEFPILLAGLLLGPFYGGIVGGIVPILSSLFTGMPPVPRLYFMIFQTISYGIVTGCLMKRCRFFISLVTGMIAGRVVFIISVAFAVVFLQFPKAMGMAFVTGLLTGIPGICIQIIVLPVLFHVLKKGGLFVG